MEAEASKGRGKFELKKLDLIRSMIMERNNEESDIEVEKSEVGENIEKKKGKRRIEIEDIKPYLLCTISNLCYAAFNIFSKLSLDKGMSRYVLVAYGHAFATFTTALLAFFFDRNIVFLGILGALFRTLFFAGVDSTSSSFAAAMINLIPALTFLLAIFCRMEKLVIKKHSSQAKIAGTLVSFGGATIMTLYKGIILISFHNQNNNDQVHQYSKSKLFLDRGWIKGSLMLFFQCLSSAAFYILQAKTIEQYPAPMVLTSLTSLAGTVVSTIVTLLLERKASVWRLSWNITLVAPLFGGIVIFGVTVYMQTLVIRKKGPVFVTAFNPLTTIMTSLMGMLILGETLHLGSVVGAILIIIGLYTILCGKEHEKQNELSKHETILDHSLDQIKLEK